MKVSDVFERNFLKELSEYDFLNLGLDQVAYIRPVQSEQKTSYNLHAADGTHLSSHDNAEIATLLAVSNDLAPVTLH